MNDPDAAIPAVDGVCVECGFDYDGLTDAEIPGALRAFGRKYRPPLTRGLPGESLDDLVRTHPQPGVWSALEYACHVRDVFAVQRERVARALAEDVPRFGSMEREERVTRDRYNDQEREAVADQLAANAEALAAAFEALSEDQWARRGLYHYPQPTERDLRWIARHSVHEGRHHLLDIGRVLRTGRGR